MNGDLGIAALATFDQRATVQAHRCLVGCKHDEAGPPSDRYLWNWKVSVPRTARVTFGEQAVTSKAGVNTMSDIMGSIAACRHG